MIIRTEGEDYPRARCDAPGCKELAPMPGEWVEANGMPWPGWNNLGWDCHGGTHKCPKHAPAKGKK